ncbi:MAG: alpha-1,4-glucan--maltose-1-phosphate maltosyltransferase [Bacteroidota bacterium]
MPATTPSTSASSSSSSTGATTDLLALPKRWSRAVIVSVSPEIDGGRWPIQRAEGEAVNVHAGVITDGHDKLGVELQYGPVDGKVQTTPMVLETFPNGKHNDDFYGAFTCDRLGRWRYRVVAWMNRFATWQDQFRRRVEGGAPRQEVEMELLDGSTILKKAAKNALGTDKKTLTALANALADGDLDAALSAETARLAYENDPREGLVASQWLQVRVGPVLERFGAWYEFFPRSAGDDPNRHATLDDAANRLPRIKEMGYDIVYLPPIHPIGVEFRKGKDNNPVAAHGEPGSPWAIGGALYNDGGGDGTKGGHKAVHPELGGMEAFERFVAKADEVGLKVALDVAFQTSPDHPYVEDHPTWFQHRADGTIRYAENPPKKYQDVYPLDFETDDAPALWNELKSVFEFWIERGVTVFRVDNPHTKPFAFWAWCLADLRDRFPETIYLAEAFSRPKVMYTLAKLGYNNSYTYFSWRSDKQGLQDYCRELFQTEVGEYYRPNFWPNTPDILTDELRDGGRPTHIARFVLAATLSSAYGIYGPPYEHVYNHQHEKREEYRDNEKYEVRAWNWHDPTSLQPIMQRVNEIRHAHPALQRMRNLRFHETDNPQLIAYSKQARREDGSMDTILCVVNLDPHHVQAGWVNLPLWELGIDEHQPYGVTDLLGGERYEWRGTHNFVALDPHVLPAHVFVVG